MGKAMMVGLCVALAGCVGEPAQEMPECHDLAREDVAALLGIAQSAECGITSSAIDFGAWRPVGGEALGDGTSLCVYRSGGAPGLMAEVVTIGGVPVDASVSAPPRTTCECVVSVAEVCLPTGVCAVVE